MALRITAASDVIVINEIVMGIYALPGLGKTTLGFTADKPLLLDFDKGAHRAKNRKASVQVADWSDIARMTRDDLEDFNTLVVDTAGRAIDALSRDIIAGNAKRGNGGSLDLKGWGIAKSRFTAWLDQMRGFGKDVVLISHMDEKQEGDILKERLDIQGGSKAEIYKVCDAMGKLYIDGAERKLDFSPREGSLGKNPAAFEILTVPSPLKAPNFLADVIRDSKASINSSSEEMTKNRIATDAWKVKFAALDSTDAFNEMIKEVKKESTEVRYALNQAAGNYGLKYDTALGAFVEEGE